MARLDERLAEAEAALATLEEAALATLEEAAGRDDLSVLERDGAILRLVYTFEAMWKTAALLLEEQEGLSVSSPKGNDPGFPPSRDAQRPARGRDVAGSRRPKPYGPHV
jgi:hypothetical protein